MLNTIDHSPRWKQWVLLVVVILVIVPVVEKIPSTFIAFLATFTLVVLLIGSGLGVLRYVSQRMERHAN